MLKTYPSSFLLSKRLKLASLAGHLNPSCRGAQTSHMTNDATLPAPRSQQASPPPIARDQPEIVHPTPPTGARTMTYFPLGYKEAAQQWVCPIASWIEQSNG